jgi:hypothetical protein
MSGDVHDNYSIRCKIGLVHKCTGVAGLEAAHQISSLQRTLQIGTYSTCCIPSINFLCLLSAIPRSSPTGLELGSEDSERFKALSRGLEQINNAMTLFRKRGKKATIVEGDSGDDQDEEAE